MAVSTSGGVACRVSYSRMVDILNTSSTIAVDICILALLFVANVIRDELFARVQHMIFSKLYVCDSRVDRMWRHLAC